MASPALLQSRFDLGFKRDPSRNALPAGACYDIVNLLPDLGFPLRKRGGWTAEGSDLSDITVTAGYPRHVVYAPFTAGPQVVALDDSDNHLFDLAHDIDRGAAQAHVQAPVFYRDLLLIGTSASAVPLKYSGSGAPTALGGSPPAASCFVVHKDRLLLANGNRVYFSGAGNPESWDTTNSWLDTSAPIRGMASLPAGVVVFHDGSTEIIRGTTFAPPSATGAGDPSLSLSPLFGNVGLTSPNSFATDGDSVVWADETGIYLTDGAAFTDLTLEGGIKEYWRLQADQLAIGGAGGGTSATIAVGRWKEYALISALNFNREYVDFLVCNVKKRSFFRLDGIRAKNFSAQTIGTNALYFSNQSTKQAGDLASVFAPDSTNTSDPDGWPVNPVLETGYFELGSKGKKRARDVYVGYDLRGTNEELTVAYAKTPEATAYTTAGTLPVTTEYARRRVRLGASASGFSLKLSSGFTEDLRLYSIEADAYPVSPSGL